VADNEGKVHQITAGGLAASHPDQTRPAVFVGAATANEFNTVRAFLAPSACFRLEDDTFAMNSSFISEFKSGPLKDLLALQPGSKISIFGHTDPVGQDDFNKVLAGRRAQSMLGILLRDTPLWEDLYRHHDNLGKDKWGVASVQNMLNRTPFPTGRADGVLDEPTKTQLKQFEAARGLPPNGFDSKQEITQSTFAQLAKEYMDAICIDDDRKPFSVTRDDFLARGKGSDGKGDIQGCGEFNPILLFSKADKAELDRPERKAERNSRNQPNRRAMILLFRPGSEIDPTQWPCPTVKEGVAGCKARFFSDADQRRKNADEEREFVKTKDTFACRFYQRMLESSPCEGLLRTIQVRLFDRKARPLPFAPCLVSLAGKPPQPHRASGVAGSTPAGSTPSDDETQDALITVRDLKVPTTLNLKWSRPQTGDGPNSPLPAPTDEFEFELEVAIDIPEDKPEAASLTRLTNMGYVRGPTRVDNIREFQRDYKPRFAEIEIDGTLNAATQKAIKEVHDTCTPNVKR